MKKYAVYDWMADDEGGTDICLAEEWTPMRDYYPESGWRAKPSTLVGYVDTVDELAHMLWKRDNDLADAYEEEAKKNTNPHVKYGSVVRQSLETWLIVANEMFNSMRVGI